MNLLWMILLLSSVSPTELETAGRLVEAGSAWQEEGDIEGQARIAARLLEEALYAGHADRAMILIGEMELLAPGEELTDFWRARAAWSCGLSRLAVKELERIGLESSDPWLARRALGLAALFSENGHAAAEHLLASISLGSTSRRRFWSALDLCSAYLNIGDTESALELAGLLAEEYPSDALAPVMLGLCLHCAGRYSESFSTLSSVDASSPAALDMAAALMKGFEQ